MEKGSPDPGGDHLLPGQVLHLRDEDAAGELLPEEGGEPASPARRLRAAASAGSVTRAQVREIAEKKLKDLNAVDVEAAMRMVEGSARSMGLEVVD